MFQQQKIEWENQYGFFFHIFLTLYFFSVKNFPVFNRSNPETTKFDSVFLNIQATPRKTVRRLEFSDIPCGMKVKTNDKKPHENSFFDEERRRFSSKKLCSRRSLTFLVNSISLSLNIKTVLRQVASMSKKIESNFGWSGIGKVKLFCQQKSP